VSISPWAWAALIALVLVLVLVDLLLVGRGGTRPGMRTAAIWSAAWIALGIGFAGLLWAWQGGDAATAYVTGYLVEKSLSMDNVFVFALLFTYFAVPPALQARALLWGILAALVLRGAFILAGAAMLDAVSWTIYLFGAFLVLTGIRLARHTGVEVHPERNPLLRLLRRALPVTGDYQGDRVLVRREGMLMATPLLAVLVSVAAADIMFAVDSIPAIFAVTRESFLVFAANAFALLGLRALYFLLAGAMSRFVHLQVGLAAVLILVGAKMLASDLWHAPAWASLVAVLAIIGTSIATSLRATRPGAAAIRSRRARPG
jgi:tellurite resistance protein TerC